MIPSTFRSSTRNRTIYCCEQNEANLSRFQKMFLNCSKTGLQVWKQCHNFVAVLLEIPIFRGFPKRSLKTKLFLNGQCPGSSKETKKTVLRSKMVKINEKTGWSSLFVAAKVPLLGRFRKNATKVFRKRSFFVAVMPRKCSAEVPKLWRKCS